MQASPRSISELPDPFMAAEASYIGRVAQESGRWNDTGLYVFIADAIDLQAGKTHLDAGCGLAQMPGILKMRQPRSVVIGADNNNPMLMAAHQLLQANRIPSSVYINTGYRGHSDHVIEKTFTADPELLAQLNIHRPDNPAVHLIADDVRKAAVLRKILEGRHIDSGSFLFPGIGSANLVQFPFSVDLPDEERPNEEEQLKRAASIMQDVRRAVYRLMSEFVRPGGKLIVAEKMWQVQPDMPKDQIYDSVRIGVTAAMGDCTRYWIDRRSHTTTDTFAAIDNGMLSQPSLHTPPVQDIHIPNGFRVGIHEMVRNELPFERRN